MPVPLVVMIACTSAAATSCRSMIPRTRSGSSVTMARPATSCPAATSRSAIARPLVSVSIVRVSLTVTMKQRTDCCARALCSDTLIPAIVARRACYDPPMPGPGQRRERAKPRTSAGFCSLVRLLAAGVLASAVLAAAPRDPFMLDRAAERWVEQTMKRLSPDEKVGQLIVPSFESNFLSTDSDTFESLNRMVREYHVGGFHVF